MGQIYHFLGLSTQGSLKQTTATSTTLRLRVMNTKTPHENLKPCSRRDAYKADITYGTNNEFGFDYLRDNMVREVDQLPPKRLNFAIVDEVDSILIDEARTPLIISAPASPRQRHDQFAKSGPSAGKKILKQMKSANRSS